MPSTTAIVPMADPTLAEIVRRLVETYHQLRIYLFGSRARSAATADSDYDLMVIVSDDIPPSLHRGGRAYEVLWGLSTGADVLVWTESSFSKRLHLRASLPSTVLREGRLLYSI
jgi:predicted nucleotidyltransferase